jgi:peptide deformylase
MKLVAENNRILTKKCIPFDFENPVMDPYELSDALHKIRREGGGIGLAAPQVGIDAQAFVIGMGKFETKEAQEFEQIFFNPVITSLGEETELVIEGCLSFPDLFIKIRRPKDIVLEWYTEEGTWATQNFGEMTSRIIQHEVDHLNGITFQTKAHSHHLLKAKKERILSERRRKRIEKE